MAVPSAQCGAGTFKTRLGGTSCFLGSVQLDTRSGDCQLGQDWSVPYTNAFEVGSIAILDGRPGTVAQINMTIPRGIQV